MLDFNDAPKQDHIIFTKNLIPYKLFYDLVFCTDPNIKPEDFEFDSQDFILDPVFKLNFIFGYDFFTNTEKLIDTQSSLQKPQLLSNLKNIKAIIYNINGVPGLCLDIPLNGKRPFYTVYFYKRPVPEAGDHTNIQSFKTGFYYDDVQVKRGKLFGNKKTKFNKIYSLLLKVFEKEFTEEGLNDDEKKIRFIIEQYQIFKNPIPLKLALKTQDQAVIMHPETLSLLADIATGKKNSQSKPAKVKNQSLIDNIVKAFLMEPKKPFYFKGLRGLEAEKTVAAMVSKKLLKNDTPRSENTLIKDLKDYLKKK
ncbi:MAG: hypothetical protein RBR08_11330 [Desulforegulaceae bacterium]|nr:hypothetical protein [Desulforegulaceae bacterium]